MGCVGWRNGGQCKVGARSPQNSVGNLKRWAPSIALFNRTGKENCSTRTCRGGLVGSDFWLMELWIILSFIGALALIGFLSTTQSAVLTSERAACFRCKRLFAKAIPLPTQPNKNEAPAVEVSTHRASPPTHLRTTSLPHILFNKFLNSADHLRGGGAHASATSSGGMGGGASWKAHDRRRGRRIARGLWGARISAGRAGVGHRVERRARSRRMNAAWPSLSSPIAPPIRGRGDGLRAAGAETGRWPRPTPRRPDGPRRVARNSCRWLICWRSFG